jgi:hypothetical protein
MWISPIPMAEDEIRWEKVPWIRSFCSRELRREEERVLVINEKKMNYW